MKHELKIIIGETANDTTLFIDDQPIGFVQNIKINVDATTKQASVDIVMPYIKGIDRPLIEGQWDARKEIAAFLEYLGEMPNVNIYFKHID